MDAAHVWGSLVVLAAVSCSGAPPPSPMTGDQEERYLVRESHKGKRVEIKLRDGSVHRGTVEEVDLARNRVRLKVELADEVRDTAFYASNVVYVAEISWKAPAGMDSRVRGPLATEDLGDHYLKATLIDYRYDHEIKDCLLDLAGSVATLSAGVLFAEPESLLRVRTIPATSGDAAPLSFAWHAHLFWGSEKKPNHRVIQQNDDQEIWIALKDAPEPQRLVLVSTPHRVENDLRGFRAVAPPGIVSYRLLPASKASRVLGNNRDFVRAVRTPHGKIHVAAVPHSEAEMGLIAYDTAATQGALMGQLRYSAQRVLLLPVLLTEVLGPKKEVRIRAGIYPRPLFMTHDVPSSALVTLEAREKALGSFPSPAGLSVGVPPRAAVRAAVGLQSSGLREGRSYSLVVAHGYALRNKEPKFFAKTLEPKAGVGHGSVSVDLSGLPREEYPTYVFVWHQMSVAWNEKEGSAEGVVEMEAAMEGPSRPSTRPFLYPSAAPHVKYILFSGPAYSSSLSALPLWAAPSFVDNTISQTGVPGPVGPITVNPVSQFSFINDNDPVFNNVFGPPGTAPIASSVANAFAGGGLGIGLATADAAALALASARSASASRAAANVSVTVNCCSCKKKQPGKECPEKEEPRTRPPTPEEIMKYKLFPPEAKDWTAEQKRLYAESYGVRWWRPRGKETARRDVAQEKWKMLYGAQKGWKR